MYGYIYKITNKINGKIYVGKHVSETLDENYWGSGKVLKCAINKYGLENFDREILQWYNSDDELNAGEIFWIDKLNSTNKDVGYNLTSGGTGGNTIKYLSEDEKALRLEKIKIAIENKTEEEKLIVHNKLSERSKRIAEIRKERGEPGTTKGTHWYTNGIEDKMCFKCPDNFWPGRSHANIDYSFSDIKLKGRKWFNNGVDQTLAYECPDGWEPGMLQETVDKQKNGRVGKVPYNNGVDEIRCLPGEEPSGYIYGRLPKSIEKSIKTRTANGPYITDEIKNKISNSVSKLWNDPEYRKIQSEAHKKYSPSEETREKISKNHKGRKRIHKDGIEKSVTLEELDKYLADGWLLGKDPNHIWYKKNNNEN